MPPRAKKLTTSDVDQPVNPVGMVPGPETQELDWAHVSLENPTNRARFWSVFPEEDREWLRAGYAGIRESLTRQTKPVLEAGAFITRTKAKIPYGKFLDLCRPETGVDARTAERWMAAAEKFEGKFDIVSNLNLTSIYALTKKGVWLRDARIQVLEKLDRGEALSIQDVEDLCSKAKTDYETRYGTVAKPNEVRKASSDAIRQDADRLFGLLKPHMAVLREVMAGDSWLDVFKALKERVFENDVAQSAA